MTIGVQDKPACGVTVESWGGFFNGGFGEGCDLVIGDTVTFSDGGATRVHVVQNLAVTGMDVDANTVFGTADAEATVNVWPHATGEQVSTIAGSDGGWLVDLNGLFDLVPGECGRAEIRDRADYLWTGATAVDWCVPVPSSAADMSGTANE